MADDNAERQFIELSNGLADAVIRRDFPTLERILGEEFVLIVPDRPTGQDRIERPQWLSMVNVITAQSYRHDDFLIRIYGDVAVATSRYEQQANYGGFERSGKFLLTDVWAKRDGRWQLVLRHSSSLAG